MKLHFKSSRKLEEEASTSQAVQQERGLTLKQDYRVKAIRKRKFISFLLLLSIMVIVQGCNTKQKNIDIAVEKVADLFEVDNKEEIKEGKTSKIKDSTNKEKITAALEAIDKIDTSGKKKNENKGIVFALHSAVLVAQMQ